MKKYSQKFIKLPNLRNIISISLLIALMTFLGFIGTANAESTNVGGSGGMNSDRKVNCKSAGGTVSTSGSTLTCTLRGDTGTATVTCTDGGSCICTGSACDEFGGGDAIGRVKNPRNLRDKFKGVMSTGKAPSKLKKPKAPTRALRARGRFMGRQGFAPKEK
jgi:hypothetical protein